MRRSRNSSNGQISLFEGEPDAPSHPVVDALAEMNVDEMTPVEALVKLASLKDELRSEE